MRDIRNAFANHTLFICISMREKEAIRAGIRENGFELHKTISTISAQNGLSVVYAQYGLCASFCAVQNTFFPIYNLV